MPRATLSGLSSRRSFSIFNAASRSGRPDRSEPQADQPGIGRRFDGCVQHRVDQLLVRTGPNGSTDDHSIEAIDDGHNQAFLLNQPLHDLLRDRDVLPRNRSLQPAVAIAAVVRLKDVGDRLPRLQVLVATAARAR